jgi:hypothetical protein
MSPNAVYWVLSAFDRQTDQLVERIELPALNLDEAREAFGLPAEDPMLDSYPVTADQLGFLGRLVQELPDLERYDWFFDAYAVEPAD